jgi:uncharacterized OB-fold protein
MTGGLREGRFELQVCKDCSAVQYPPREACHRCLSARLQWRAQSGEGTLLGTTTLHHSNDPFFRERLPWRLGLVQLAAGPVADRASARRGGRCARAREGRCAPRPCGPGSADWISP